MKPQTMRVEWRDGQLADVSRELYAWITTAVPEAATPEARADLYSIGVKLSRMLPAVGDATTATDQMRVAKINAASADVVDAWDRLMTAMAAHPTYAGDHHAACEAAGVGLDAATRYAEVLRGLIARYRAPVKLPKGGRAPRLRVLWLVDFAEQVRQVLGVGEQRASEIVADLATRAGIEADAQSLRQAMRNRRVRKG